MCLIVSICTITFFNSERKERKTMQAAKHSMHQLRKRRHIGPKCRESSPPNSNLQHVTKSNCRLCNIGMHLKKHLMLKFSAKTCMYLIMNPIFPFYQGHGFDGPGKNYKLEISI